MALKLESQLTPSDIEEIRKRPVVKLLEESEIVISGLAGRFPLSSNFDEFTENLYNKVDMITPDENEDRWPKSK